jgi:hypothetical protein
MGIVLFPIYAFASSNSGMGVGGESVAPISGWEITNISYQLADDPSQVQSVTFDLDAPAEHVSVKLNSSSPEFTTCTDLSAYHWRCSFHTGVSVASMDEFRVIAVGN